MRVSTQFPIAVHILLMVAGFPDVKVTSEIVAESVGCNPTIIRNIFAKLKNAGILNPKSGKGKTKLARTESEITLWDIYTAVESPETDELFKFHQRMSAICPIGRNIHSLLGRHLDDAVASLRDELSKVSLETLKCELYAALEKE